MPCYDGREEQDREDARRRLDITARLACEFCKILEETSRRIPSYAVGWWAAHKEADKQRERAEQVNRTRSALQKQALSKLTPEERSALGLH